MNITWLLTEPETHEWLSTFEQTDGSARIWVIRFSMVLNLIYHLFKANNKTSGCHCIFYNFKPKKSSCVELDIVLVLERDCDPADAAVVTQSLVINMLLPVRLITKSMSGWKY